MPQLVSEDNAGKQIEHEHSKNKLVEVHVHKLDDEEEEEEWEVEGRRGPSEAKLVLQGSREGGRGPPKSNPHQRFNAQRGQLQKPSR